ncbi:MAG: ATP synthase F0 subunit A [Bacteroidetes bacterium CG2_30_33_31]|nr:MAG: ATP synthase F0 subunit A [Bacteroidetes bacterium CG2_30_33_31]
MNNNITASLSKYLLIFIGIIALTFSTLTISANENMPEQKKEFDAGEMIFEHVLDAHDWHIISIGEHHIAIPLPIIIFDKDERVIHVFSSSRLAHEANYLGYKLPAEGEFKGKLIKESAGNSDSIIDFSITKTVFSIMFSAFLLILIFVSIAQSYKKRKDQAPKGLQSMLEPLILFIRDDVAKSAIGSKEYMRFMPFLLTVFFFIFLNNLMGIIPIFPGGSNVTGNIGITMVLAVFTFVITSFNGSKSYWTHMINMPGVPWWLKFPIPLMPIVEIMGVFTKPFVLMVRLFANMLAGHIVVLGFMSMIFIFGAINEYMGLGVSVVSVAFSVFLSLLELLVAFIQAYVFTLLSSIYIGMALEKHH